jgi:hypothetical protein
VGLESMATESRIHQFNHMSSKSRHNEVKKDHSHLASRVGETPQRESKSRDAVLSREEWKNRSNQYASDVFGVKRKRTLGQLLPAPTQLPS